jgi:hypothetical protein
MNRRERASLHFAKQPLAVLRPTRSSDTLIFLPTYNECETIGRMMDALLALPISCDVLVVDDRSTDLLSRAAAEPRLAVMVRPGRLGIGRPIFSAGCTPGISATGASRPSIPIFPTIRPMCRVCFGSTTLAGACLSAVAPTIWRAMRWACQSRSTRPRCVPHGSTACLMAGGDR